jgi:hypothetical protein
MQEQTEAQRIGREAGAAIAHALADNLEMIIMRLADSISKLQAEQRRQADDLGALSIRVETLTTATRDAIESLEGGQAQLRRLHR